MDETKGHTQALDAMGEELERAIQRAKRAEVIAAAYQERLHKLTSACETVDRAYLASDIPASMMGQPLLAALDKLAGMVHR